jgi:acyl transferase domain-containing protein
VTSLDELETKLRAVLAGDEAVERLYRGQAKRNKDDLAVLASDEDMASTLQAWVRKGKYHKLLELWVKGLTFDWGSLYEGLRPQRVPLPTYPFAAVRHWFGPAEQVPWGQTPPAQLPRQSSTARSDGFNREFFAELFHELDSGLLSVESAYAKARAKM